MAQVAISCNPRGGLVLLSILGCLWPGAGRGQPQPLCSTTFKFSRAPKERWSSSCLREPGWDPVACFTLRTSSILSGFGSFPLSTWEQTEQSPGRGPQTGHRKTQEGMRQAAGGQADRKMRPKVADRQTGPYKLLGGSDGKASARQHFPLKQHPETATVMPTLSAPTLSLRHFKSHPGF